MASADRLASIQLKFKRTKKHVIDLQQAVQAYWDSGPYKIGANRDPDTRKPVYYLAHIDSVPDDIAVIASDALGGMASTLDHIVYQLFLSAGGTRGTYSGGTRKKNDLLYFPIFDDVAKYKAGREGKVKGITRAAIDAIDALEPYYGGAGHQFWVLKELNNLSKHRELMAVASQLRSVDIGGDLARRMQEVVDVHFPDEPRLPAFSLFIQPADNMCPLKVGDKLFTVAQDAEIDKNRKFKFQVSLHEPGIVEAEPLIETVHQLANLVESAIGKLEPFL